MSAEVMRDIGVKVTAENKCSFCTGSICCTYITHQIDTPKSIQDFDQLLWQVSHRNIQLYKDEDGWFLLINETCVHLLPGDGCGIYDTRPMVCREHDNDFCEFDAPAEEGFELFFADHEALDRYCRQRFKGWDKRFERK